MTDPRPVAVPTLDDLAAHPDRAAALPPDVRRALTLRALAVIGTLAVADGPNAAARTESAPVGDLLDVDEAARRLGVSRSWLYRNARRLPFTVRMGVMLRFDPRGLAKYVASWAGSARAGSTC